MTALFRDAEHFLQTGDIVVQVLDHIERGRDVETLVSERQLFRQAFLYNQTLAFAKFESVVRNINALRLPNCESVSSSLRYRIRRPKS